MRRSAKPPSRRRQLALSLVIAAMLVVAPAACGDDDSPGAGEGGGAAATETTTDGETTSGGGGTSTTPSAGAIDGRLTTSDGEVITDYGDRGDRVAAVRALDRLQREFRSGAMVAACRRINDFLLTQFAPPRTDAYTPCPRKLAAYAAQRARRDERPGWFRLLWVRSYTQEAGLWVADESGDLLRIQMTREPDTGWRYDLGPQARPDILAATLRGANYYIRNGRRR
jgi:hypothetical protein